jgi:hypothetical protein|tara:strand:- start:233 stop:976 length:744 start_codon:yes stop_codon:yes gene_type:complete
MIISYSKKFVYLRTIKVASTSLEIYFSQFCNRNDTLSPLYDEEEKLKTKLKLPNKRNYQLKKFSLSLKNILKFNFYSPVNLYDHTTIKKILKTTIRHKIKDCLIFSFVRNPYDWIVSSFWGDLYYHKKNSIRNINKMDKDQISSKFKRFLRDECKNFFEKNKKIISSDKVKIHIYKLENLKESIKLIKKKIKLRNEKIHIDKIKVKKLKINKKLMKMDKYDQDLIFNCSSYFFSRFNYSKRLPEKYR